MRKEQGNLGEFSKMTGELPQKGGPNVLSVPATLLCSLGHANKIDGKAMSGDEAGVKKQQDLINSLGGGSSRCKSATSAVLLGKGLQHKGGGGGGTLVSPSQTKVILTS